MKVSLKFKELPVIKFCCLTVSDGSSYAYTSLSLAEKEVQELGEHLRPYVHLQNLNLSKNDIRNIEEVIHLEFLLSINASTNSIKDITFLKNYPESLQYLQVSVIVCNV